MSGPPGRQSRPSGESGPAMTSLTADSVPHSSPLSGDVVQLRYGLVARYVRDTDPQSVTLRRVRRNKRLTEKQARAYKAWLDEQRQESAS